MNTTTVEDNMTEFDSMSEDKIIECGLVSSVLWSTNPKKNRLALASVEPNYFCDQFARAAWEVMRTMDEHTFDGCVIASELKRHKSFVGVRAVAWVSELFSNPFADFAGTRGTYVIQRARAVVKAYKLREFIDNQRRSLEDKTEEYIERAIASLEKLQEISVDEETQKSWQESVAEYADDLDRPDGMNSRRLLTGLPALDAEIIGFEPGHLVVIGARPSVGKSAMAMTIAMHQLRNNRPVLYVTVEMSTSEMVGRMIAAECHVPMNISSRGMMGHEQRASFVEAQNRVASWPISVVSAAVTVDQIETRLIEMDPRPKMLVVDYIQLLKPSDKSTNREQQVAECSRRLKQIATDYELVVICVAQLNRQATDIEPQLSHLRESGSIENDASVVLLLNRTISSKDGDTRAMDVFVRKNRNGKTGGCVLQYDGPTFSFDDSPMRYEQFDSFSI